jgi:hypothetical protein
MATPVYFSPVKIGPHGRQQTFVGGPLGANNPTRELLKEASALFGKQKLVSQIISVGCGRSHVSSMEMYPNTEAVCRVVQEMAADCEMVDKDLSTRFCDMDAYLRLNVDRGMENLAMNQWDDVGPIGTHTSAYAETVAISEAVEASLKRLHGSTGTITLSQISKLWTIYQISIYQWRSDHPITAIDVRDQLEKQREVVDVAIESVRNSGKCAYAPLLNICH